MDRVAWLASTKDPCPRTSGIQSHESGVLAGVFASKTGGDGEAAGATVRRSRPVLVLGRGMHRPGMARRPWTFRFPCLPLLQLGVEGIGKELAKLA